MNSDIRFIKDAIRTVEKIPENKWCVDVFDNGKGQCCVLGHFGMTNDNRYNKILTHRAMRLYHLVLEKLDLCLNMINNGAYWEFNQKSIKARNLEALKKTLLIIEKHS